MGLVDPVNKRIALGDGFVRITGVVSDSHFQTMDKAIEPFIFYPTLYARVIYVRTTAAKAPEAIAAVDKLRQQYNPDYEFSYQFMDETFEKMLRADTRNGALFNIFTVIGIFISCLGLFGLATYTAESRTKEIGIRKAIGANTLNIITTLSKEFLLLVGISVSLAPPFAYMLTNQPPQGYAYRINISWRVFVLAALIVIVLVVLTVSGQALRAARANPRKSDKNRINNLYKTVHKLFVIVQYPKLYCSYCFDNQRLCFWHMLCWHSVRTM
ncbi:MAG: hypothetical protein LBG19_09930 [Prevotellaceae bacterium]|jgi:hypothetical protein|nr:hypothetical protein [Prevotellaceae bacterium]